MVTAYKAPYNDVQLTYSSHGHGLSAKPAWPTANFRQRILTKHV